MDNMEDIGNFYNSKFQEYGSDVKAVGWSTTESQVQRYLTLLDGADIRGKSIIDLGCGLGGLIPILRRLAGDDFQYLGIDVSDAFVSYCKQNFHGESLRFTGGNFLELDLQDADFVFASGVFTLNLPGMHEYANMCLDKMFRLSRIASAANFLSDRADYQIGKNLHYDPTRVLKSALLLTPNVTLLHGKPKFEFSVILKR